MPIAIYRGTDRPPPMHWKECHPSTAKRFKAELTCEWGHSLVLKGHSVREDGRVWPSVVCMKPGCTFHQHVKLLDWTSGTLH